MAVMRTVIVGDRPPEIEEWLRLRRERGQDRFDEIWRGVYHVAPAPGRRHGQVDADLALAVLPRARAARLVASGPCNIGGPDDYRVPDQAYFRGASTEVWSRTAAVVVEVVSPDDETRAKLGFHHRHGVDEVVIADPEAPRRGDPGPRTGRLRTGPGERPAGRHRARPARRDPLARLARLTRLPVTLERATGTATIRAPSGMPAARADRLGRS